MADLRDRIAEALHARHMSRLDWQRPWAELHSASQEVWLADADAVIAALGLRREDGANLTHFRHVTDWQEFGTNE